jgi:hypothetical protein
MSNPPNHHPLGTACLNVSFLATTTDTITVAADLDTLFFILVGRTTLSLIRA